LAFHEHEELAGDFILVADREKAGRADELGVVVLELKLHW